MTTPLLITPPAKRPYVTPVLIWHGDVRTLTRQFDLPADLEATVASLLPPGGGFSPTHL